MGGRLGWEDSIPEEPPFNNLLPEDPGGPEESRNDYGRGFDAGYIKGYQVGYERGTAEASRALTGGGDE